MKEIRNLDNKRVCDISKDKKAVIIVKKECITKVYANPDGTLSVSHERLKPAI